MIRRLTLACVGLALCVAGATQLLAAGPESAAANKASDYVKTLQNADGGFPDFGATSRAGATIDAAWAFNAVGVDPNTVQKGGKSPADFLSSQSASYSASSAGAAAKLVLGLQTLGLGATSFGGINPRAVMEANYDPATGKYGTDLFAQAYFMLAEGNLGATVPAASITYIEGLQGADGGWEDCCGFGEDTNTTGLVVRTLIASGVPASDTHVVNGLAYLKASQQADGGCPYTAPGASDPDSTAFCIQAIVAAGQSVEAGGPWDKGAGATPLSALVSSQNAATGALQFFGADSAFATYQGIPGLMLDAFPERRRTVSESTATASPSSTSTLTSTATGTATRTLTATASPTTVVPTATSAPHTPTATPAVSTATPVVTNTAVRSVLGDTAAPTRTSSRLGSTRLPNTGTGRGASTDIEGWMLLLCGAMISTGAFALYRGRR